jgi:hypothetical protein
MIDAFGVEISKGLKIKLPVKLVERIADSHPRDAKKIKEIASEIAFRPQITRYYREGHNEPVRIAFSRKHNNNIDTSKPSDGLKLRLQDGHHRLAAHKLLGRKTISTDITLRRQSSLGSRNTVLIPKILRPRPRGRSKP